MTPHTILITGAAGYVGAMLAEQFSKRSDVERIVCLDKDPEPPLLSGNQKIEFIRANTAESAWQEKARSASPDIVIHAAWQIRSFYGNRVKERRWNIDGSNAVFRFAFETPSVKRLIHFSTASIYGALPNNTMEHLFREDEPMREEEYPYGVQKRKVEEDLRALVKEKTEKGNAAPAVYIVRPAAITGPRGRSLHYRFGLQSALSGTLRGSFVYGIVRLLVSFVPATKGWVRQFVHEDDVADIVGRLAFQEGLSRFSVFNLAPPGSPVLAPDMGKAVGKRVLYLTPALIRCAYFLFWHLTAGRIPTVRGSWKFYSYPLLLDGSKVEKELGHRYFLDSKRAFTENAGRYAIPT